MSSSRELAIGRLRRGLIASCQAQPGEPMADPRVLAAIAEACALGGAVGIRAEGEPNLKAVRARVALPLIGLIKRASSDSEVYITPTVEDALRVASTGCEVVALDGTSRPRPGGVTLEETVREIRSRAGCLLLADVATFEEGMVAADLGFDLVATTLSGYTAETVARRTAGPDLELVNRLSQALAGRAPVIAEGRFHAPFEARAALERGAFAVVVGTAITRPGILAQAFVEAMAGLPENGTGHG